MNYSAMTQNERIALVAGAVVAITALVSLAWNWGLIMIFSLLAGLLAVVVVIQPQALAGFGLRASKGALLLIAGVDATLVNGLIGLDNLGWMLDHLTSDLVDVLQFSAGIVAAIALLYAGWMAYRSESGMTPTSSPTMPPPSA